MPWGPGSSPTSAGPQPHLCDWAPPQLLTQLLFCPRLWADPEFLRSILTRATSGRRQTLVLTHVHMRLRPPPEPQSVAALPRGHLPVAPSCRPVPEEQRPELPRLGLLGLPGACWAGLWGPKQAELGLRLREEVALLSWASTRSQTRFPTLLFLAGEPSAGGAARPPQCPLRPRSHHPLSVSPEQECGSGTLWGLFPIPF